MPHKAKISALVITYNEMDNIKRCIDSIAFADEIIVVDSYSTDGTFEFLKLYPRVKVLQRAFKNYTDQKAYTLQQASHDWVLFVDADEVVTNALQEEIIATINNTPIYNAFWFYRTFMFKNRKMHFSGLQTDKNYRLFRKSKVSFDPNKLVHETLKVQGASGILNNHLTHYSYKDYNSYKAKIMSYGQLKAQQAYRSGKKFSYSKLILKPLWKFTTYYLIRLGFLDGLKGLIFSYIQATGEIERFRTLKQLEESRTAVLSIPQKTTSLKSA